jgi:hypothetical protein
MGAFLIDRRGDRLLVGAGDRLLVGAVIDDLG